MGERIFKFDQSDQKLCNFKSDQKSSNHNLTKDSTNRPYGPGIEAVLPPEYRTRDLHTILPDWLLKNRICPTQIVAIQHDLNLHVCKYITTYLDYAVLNNFKQSYQPQNTVSNQKPSYTDRTDDNSFTNQYFSTNEVPTNTILQYLGNNYVKLIPDNARDTEYLYAPDLVSTHIPSTNNDFSIVRTSHTFTSYFSSLEVKE